MQDTVLARCKAKGIAFPARSAAGRIRITESQPVVQRQRLMVNAMQFRRNGHSDDRRRRVLRDEILVRLERTT